MTQSPNFVGHYRLGFYYLRCAHRLCWRDSNKIHDSKNNVLFSHIPRLRACVSLRGHPKLELPLRCRFLCLEIFRRQITMMEFGRCFSWRLLEEAILSLVNWRRWSRDDPDCDEIVPVGPLATGWCLAVIN